MILYLLKLAEVAPQKSMFKKLVANCNVVGSLM